MNDPATGFSADLVASVRDVTKVYRLGGEDVKALAGVSLDFKRGDFIAIMGSSGSGKSTAVSLVERFYDPDKGKVTLDGVNLKEFSVQFLRIYIIL